MKLGEFDKERAKAEAISFLSKSIATLSGILGIDTSLMTGEENNPHDESSHFYSAFNVLQAEIKALRKLVD